MSIFSSLLALVFAVFTATPATVLPTDPVEPANLYLSTDSGANWLPFNEGLPEKAMPVEILDREDDLLLITAADGVFHRPKGAMLINEHQQWSSISKGLPAGIYLTTIAAKGNQLVVGTFEQGVFISSNGGKNWRKPIFNLKSMVHSLLFHEGKLLASTEGGLFESMDGGETWHPLGKIYRVNQLHLHKGKLMAIRQNSLGVIKGAEATWSDFRTEWAIGDVISYQNYLYIRTSVGNVFRSKDGELWEKSWQLTPSIFSKTLPEALWKGYEPQLPGDLEVGTIMESSIGWLAGVRGGC